MRRFTKVAPEWYLEENTLEFTNKLPLSCEVGLPFFAKDNSSFAQRIMRTIAKVKVLELNKLTIAFTLKEDESVIQFTGRRGIVNFRLTSVFHRHLNMNEFLYVDNTLVSAGGQVVHRTTTIPSRGVDGLFHEDSYAFTMGVMSYGLSPRKLFVEYNGRRLSGTSFALLVGSWAILLGDDLTFDSLVSIKGTRRDTLITDKIFYTENPYLLKVLVMSK